jgi:hypothetical protein
VRALCAYIVSAASLPRVIRIPQKAKSPIGSRATAKQDGAVDFIHVL